MELVLLCFVGSSGRTIWLLTWSGCRSVGLARPREPGGRLGAQLTAGHHRDQKGRNVFFVRYIICADRVCCGWCWPLVGSWTRL